MKQRIAKLINRSGFCSRREAEALIENGRVKLDGKIVSSPVVFIDQSAKIAIDDKLIDLSTEKPRLWIYYKPVSLVTTHKDDMQRATVFGAIKGLPRVISVGRLDINSEGLLLLTNNGELARALSLPSNKLERVYKVRAYGKINSIMNHRNIVTIDGVKYTTKYLKLVSKNVKKNIGNWWFEVVLTEGKNRELRKIFEFYGLAISRLIRTRYGPFELENLQKGMYKEVDFCRYSKFL